jgi:hypothetical protein
MLKSIITISALCIIFLSSLQTYGQTVLYDSLADQPIRDAYFQIDTLYYGNSTSEGSVQVPYHEGKITVSHIAYRDTTISFSRLEPLPDTLYMQSATYSIPTVGISAKSVKRKRLAPLKIVRLAIKAKDNRFSNEVREEYAFYREIFSLSGQALTVNEALVKLRTASYDEKPSHKKAYKRGWERTTRYIGAASPSGAYNSMVSYPEGTNKYPAQEDVYQIVEARYCTDEARQTSYPIFSAGPLGLIALDKLRLEYDFLNPSLLKKYNYTISDTIIVNNTYCYEISFEPADGAPTKNFGLSRTHKTGVFRGKIFIAIDDFTLVRTEATNAKSIVPNGLTAKYNRRLNEETVRTVVNYRPGEDSRWRLSSVSSELVAGANPDYSSVRTLSIYPKDIEVDAADRSWLPFDFSSILRSYIGPYNQNFWSSFANTAYYPFPEDKVSKTMVTDSCFRGAFDRAPIVPPSYPDNITHWRIGGKRLQDGYRDLEDPDLLTIDKLKKENKYYDRYFLLNNSATRSAALQFTDEALGYRTTSEDTNEIPDTLLRRINGVVGLYAFAPGIDTTLIVSLDPLPEGYVFSDYGGSDKADLYHFVIEDRNYNRRLLVYDRNGKLTELPNVSDYEWRSDTLHATVNNEVFRTAEVKSWSPAGKWKDQLKETDRQFEFRLSSHPSGRLYAYLESLIETELYEWLNNRWNLLYPRAVNTQGRGRARAWPGGIQVDVVQDYLTIGEDSLAIVIDSCTQYLCLKRSGDQNWQQVGLPSGQSRTHFEYLPGQGYVLATEGVGSYGKRYSLNMETAELVEIPPSASRIELAGFKDSIVWRTADDGVEIPIQIRWKIASRKSLKGTVLKVYAAYGNPYLAGHSNQDVAWMNAGFAVGYVHARGGGALGSGWYDAGRAENKIVACTDYLSIVRSFGKRHPLGTPIPMFGYAQSAGGPVLGYAVNTAPDLFRGVIFDYAFLDVVTVMAQRDLPLTVYEFPEWGDPRQEEMLTAQLRYSPYQNIKPQNYPSHLFLAGGNDKSTPYWQILKHVAKLRNSTQNEEPILLYTALKGTHPGTPFGPGQKQMTEQLGFLLTLSERLD